MSSIEDVMDLESFVHLRTHIWRSLREEKDEHGADGAALTRDLTHRSRSQRPALRVPSS